MIENGQISISTQALLAIIVQTASETEARKAANVFDVSDEELDKIIQSPQAFIDHEQYQDQQLSIIKDTVQANKAVHLENKDKDKFMIVFPGDNSTLIMEKIDLQSKMHTFYLKEKSELNKVFGDFYGLDITLEDELGESVRLTHELSSQLLNMETEKLDYVSENKEYDLTIRQIFDDLKRNNQRINKLLFLKKDYEDEWEVESGVLFLPGERHIWDIKLDDPFWLKSDVEGVWLHDSKVNGFVNHMEGIMIRFLKKKKSTSSKNKRNKVNKKDKKETKFFSLKRGFSFFWKSNLFLLVAILFFFINKSSWISDDGTQVISFALLWEALIIFCSFIACFKDREYK